MSDGDAEARATRPELAGHVVLVTGASRGIGAAVADALAARGATVIGTATTEAGAERIKARLAGGDGMALDVTDGEQVERVHRDIRERHGAPSALVNNAGITRDKLLMRMSEADWNDVLDTNLSGVYRLCRAVVAGMIKARRGRIVNIGSVVGAQGNLGQANYAAAKAGLLGFSRALALEVAARGVTVNVVAPGFIETDMTARMSASAREAIIDNIPARRLGTPEDVAACVAFLLSDAAAYITGHTLHVNGGLHRA